MVLVKIRKKEENVKTPSGPTLAGVDYLVVIFNDILRMWSNVIKKRSKSGENDEKT